MAAWPGLGSSHHEDRSQELPRPIKPASAPWPQPQPSLRRTACSNFQQSRHTPRGVRPSRQLISGLLAKIPDFRFKDFKLWIDTPDGVFGEYAVEARVIDTGKLYRQTYAGLLIAEGGKIKLLREALDTAERRGHSARTERAGHGLLHSAAVPDTCR